MTEIVIGLVSFVVGIAFEKFFAARLVKKVAAEFVSLRGKL